MLIEWAKVWPQLKIFSKGTNANSYLVMIFISHVGRICNRVAHGVTRHLQYDEVWGMAS